MTSPIAFLGTKTRIATGYEVGAFRPKLVLDGATNSFFVNRRGVAFADAVSVARSSNATYMDSSFNPQTASANVARSNHHFYVGDVLKVGSLFERTAATNLLIQTSDLTASGWVTGSETTTTASGNAARIQFSGSGNGNTQGFSRTVTVTGFESKTSVAQMQVRTYNGGADQTFRLRSRANYDGSGFSADLTATSEWRDFSFAQALDGTTVTSMAVGIASNVANGAADLEVRMLQLVGDTSTPSSWIPTTAAAATRDSEVTTIPHANLPWGAAITIQMEGFMTYADTDEGLSGQHYEWRDDDNNRIMLRFATNSSKTGQPEIFQIDEAASQSISGPQAAYSPGINVPFNLASRHGEGFVNMAYQGNVLTAKSVGLPDLETTDLKLITTGGPVIITLFRMWNEDLGDAGIGTAST